MKRQKIGRADKLAIADWVTMAAEPLPAEERLRCACFMPDLDSAIWGACAVVEITDGVQDTDLRGCVVVVVSACRRDKKVRADWSGL